MPRDEVIDHQEQHAQGGGTYRQHPAARHVLVGFVAAGPLGNAACRLVANRLDNGLGQRGHGPQRRDADDARPQKAGLAAPELGGQLGERLAGRRRRLGRQPGHDHAPAQRQPHKHGNACGRPHQIAGSQQGGRKACRHAKGHAACGNPEIEGIAKQTQTAAEKAEQRGQPRTPTQLAQARTTRFAQVLRIVKMALLIAYAQHLGSGHALGIGQLGLHHQHAAQGHGVEHAQRAAGRADQCRLPERETRPQPQHEQCRQHKDDRRQGAGRGGLGLHQIVFKDVGILEAIEQRHGDHGSGNRRGKGQPDLEAQVDIGRREGQRDERAQNDAAQREFTR